MKRKRNETDAQREEHSMEAFAKLPALGWSVYHLGGGCRAYGRGAFTTADAWFQIMEPGEMILALPESADRVHAILMRSTSETWMADFHGTLEEALAWVAETEKSL